MLKSGIGEDAEKQHAAEAFINYISRPDNVIRNMYYVGYTSVIAGGDDQRIFEFADYNFSAEDDEEDTVEYPLGWFFTGDNEDEDYIITAPSEQLHRQMVSQYPSQEDISRSCIMLNFDKEESEALNRMWINVRCFNIRNVPGWVWVLTAVALAALIGLYLRRRIYIRSLE